MKRIIIISLLLMYLFSANAQHTLQFNQVLLVNSSQTVPANHVWKIESALSNAARKAFSPYDIIINGSKVYVGDYMFSGKGWMDIKQINVYGMMVANTCASGTFFFKYNGFEASNPFWNRSISIPSSSITNSWTLLGTVSPVTTGNTLEITGVEIYDSYWVSMNVRLDVTYMDNSTSSNTFVGYQSSVCQSNGYQWLGDSPGSSSPPSAYATIPESELYKSPTQLPIWVPAGTTVQSGDNISSVSVIDYIVQ